MLLALLLLLILVGVFPLSIYLAGQFNREEEMPAEILDADLLQPDVQQATQTWWERRRPLFNQSLILAGLAAFLFYHLMTRTDTDGFNFMEPGAYLLLLQIIAYVIYMGVANLFFNLGPILETGKKLEEPHLFRQKTLHTMVVIAMIIPLGTAVALYLLR